MRREIGTSGSGHSIEQRRYDRLSSATESNAAGITELQKRVSVIEDGVATSASTAEQ